MNTLSTLMSVIGVLGERPMYSSACSMDFLRPSSSHSLGSGTLEVTSVTIPGLVPQLTCGAIFSASSETDLSNSASGSVDRSFQLSMAAS